MGQEKNDSGRSGNGVPVRRILGLAVALALLAGAACSSNPRAAARAFTTSGKRYLAQKKYSQASIQFRNALQREPKNWDVRFLLAVSEFRLGDLPAYYRDLRAVIAAEPSFAPARLDMAALDIEGDQTLLAQQEINSVLAKDPGNERASLLQMKLDLTSKHYHAAAKQCALLRRRMPGNGSVDGMCGLGDLGLHELPAAEKAFRQALALQPGSASDTRDVANVLVLQGHVRQAEALLTGAARKYPNSLGMQLVLADFYVRHGHVDRAAALFAGLSRHQSAFPHLDETLGSFWMGHDELTRAVADFRKAETAHPQGKTEANLASAYLTLRQISEAERYTDAVLRRHPHSSAGEALQGALSYMNGDYTQAEQQLQGALKNNPQSLLAKFYLGMTYLAEGELDRARGAFTNCIGMNDKFLQAYVKLGQIALESGDWRLGAAYARRVDQVSPGSPDAFLLLAQAEMMHHDLPQAGRVIEAAERLPSAPPQVHQLAARYDILEHKFTAADKQFHLALAGTGNGFPMIRWYVGQLATAGQSRRAIADLQNWMAKTSRTPRALALLAELDLANGRTDQAESAAQQAIAGNPRLASAHIAMGEVLERRQQTARAIGEYTSAIRMDPHQTQGYLLAANLFMHQSHYRRAQNEYQAILGQFPDSDPAKLGLANSLADRGAHLNRALSLAQGLKSHFPHDPRVADALGWVYHQKGFQTLALSQLESAERALPHDATIEFHLGMTLDADGQKGKGRLLLARALKGGLAPENEAAARRTLGISSIAQAKSH